jgi:predicted RND superfamily exporter protein
MFQKPHAYFFLGIAGLISVILLIFRPIPQFNYDFEQFFPQNDDDLEFYQAYRNKFENDNDYLLLAVSNANGELLDSSFLAEAFDLQLDIGKLDRVDTVISILNLEKPIIGIFGMQKVKVLDWSDSKTLASQQVVLKQFSSELISKNGESLLLWIKNEQNISKENGDELYFKINQLTLESHLEIKAVAGKIQAQGDFVNLMQREFGVFFGCSILLMLVMLALIFRTWWGVFIPFVILIIGVVWAFGLILYLGKALDVMSVMQPTIFLIVGLSSLIHFFNHLIKKLRTGVSKAKAIRAVFKSLLVPVWLTILTTSLGFFSLYFTSIPALKEFGLTTGLGILVMFVAVILIAPGMLFFFPIKVSEMLVGRKYSLNLSSLFLWLLRKRKTIAISFIVVTLLSGILGTQLRINGFLLDDLPEDHPIQRSFTYFDSQFGGSNPLEIHLSSGSGASNLLDLEVLVEIDQLEREVSRLFNGGQIISPLTVIKSLNQAQNQGDMQAFALPSKGQYQRMQRFLNSAFKETGSKILSEDLKTGRLSSRSSDLGTVEMSKKRALLKEFSNREIEPALLQIRWTGTAFLIDKGHQSVTWQMAKGLGMAFVFVGIIAGFLFRSWRISFILLIPNLIPLIWMLGLMYLLGIEFKLTTAILFTVAFGIAVDDSIHFMTRLRKELMSGKNLIYGLKRTFLETGEAIIQTTVILVAGFGLLIFSQFGVTHFTGLLIASALIFALLADLFLLPILLLPMKKKWDQKFKKRLAKAPNLPK